MLSHHFVFMSPLLTLIQVLSVACRTPTGKETGHVVLGFRNGNVESYHVTTCRDGDPRRHLFGCLRVRHSAAQKEAEVIQAKLGETNFNETWSREQFLLRTIAEREGPRGSLLWWPVTAVGSIVKRVRRSDPPPQPTQEEAAKRTSRPCG